MLLGRFRLDEENIQISRGKKINILNYTKNSNINALSFLDMSSGVTTNGDHGRDELENIAFRYCPRFQFLEVKLKSYFITPENQIQILK